MGKISMPGTVQSLKTLGDVIKFLSQFCTNVAQTINGNLSFENNLKCSIVEVNFTSSNVNIKLTHNLPVVTGYFQCSSPSGGVVYDGTSGFNNQQPGIFYLKATSVGIYRVLLY